MKLVKPIVITLLLSAAASVDAQTSSRGNAEKPAFSLSVSALPAHVSPGEPIQLTVSLVNNSRDEFSLSQENGISGEVDYDVFVTDAQGADAPTTAYYRSIKGKRLPQDTKTSHAYSSQILILQPGQSTNSRIDLGRLFKIDEPGTYRVWVERVEPGHNLRVKSNVVAVTVGRNGAN